MTEPIERFEPDAADTPIAVGGFEGAMRAAGERLAHAFSTARVDGDALYVHDERLWTSAGVSSGIAMALAMVEEDFGAAMKGQVAKMLVVYAHRPDVGAHLHTALHRRRRQHAVALRRYRSGRRSRSATASRRRCTARCTR